MGLGVCGSNLGISAREQAALLVHRRPRHPEEGGVDAGFGQGCEAGVSLRSIVATKVHEKVKGLCSMRRYS